jgi:hypothetical protein
MEETKYRVVEVPGCGFRAEFRVEHLWIWSREPVWEVCTLTFEGPPAQFKTKEAAIEWAKARSAGFNPGNVVWETP